jgi:C-terminal processing protease CtpA/Prc
MNYRRTLHAFLCRRIAAPLLISAIGISMLLAPTANGQELSGFDRDRGRQMLRIIKSDIQKDYYDPTFRGIDLDAHFRTADEKLKQATSLGQLFGIIAQTLIDFNDSHLIFLPPSRSSRYEYGWRMQMIGEKCFVTGIKPGSDAEKKGLQAGDELLSINGYQPTRENHWKMLYAYYSLRPVAGLRLEVSKPNGEQKQYDVMTKISQGKRVMDLTGADINTFIRESEDDERERREGSRGVKIGDVLIWKLSEFALSESEVDNALGKARNQSALIVDLRGNGGGAETTLLRMLGGVVDHDLKVGEIKRRKETKPLIAKTRGGDNVFKGKIVVLIDSGSGSASELFARALQLEERATVIGDRSAGAVMRSRIHSHQSGVDTVTFWGASITDADIIMTDGKSIEHVGVTPDQVVLPTGADIAAKRDPALALALSLVGVKLEPEKAGTLFPNEWRK